jgi:hypothetical protein
MGLRTSLQILLETIADNVYFQPPSNVQMIYPCIVYERDMSSTDFANNGVYRQEIRYQITLIDRNPDSDIFSKISALPTCTFNRHFVSDNLNHDVFTLYF